MPPISLVVCLYREGDLLARLLEQAEGCYDDLVVVHDGPDDTGIGAMVEADGGRFFEQQRAYCGEPHWPFAFGEARHDWILRLDADEFPSAELAAWLREFRRGPEPDDALSGYMAIWPYWDGKRARTRKWPMRAFLLHRVRVRVIGLCHQGPTPDGPMTELDLVLHHQPKRKCYGIRNTVLRPMARRWHRDIARALLGRPTDLPCWRWDDPNWPKKMDEIRRAPLRTGLKRLILSPIWNGRDMIERGEFPNPAYLVGFPLHHWMTCWSLFRLRRQQRAKS